MGLNCDQVICLSGAVDLYPSANIENVNGVDLRFLEAARTLEEGGLYFIGKLLWEKGLREMIDLLAASGVSELAVYGIGESQTVSDINAYARGRDLRLEMHGQTSKPWQDLSAQKILINCSRSEVLCTVTAEALAMGKFVIIPRHVSNEYFYSHPNCLSYDDPTSFRNQLRFALASAPTFGASRQFSWEVATERLLKLVGPLPHCQAGANC